jgi:hypothetical protein
MPKPVCPNMAVATPLGPPGAQTPLKQHAPGCSSCTPSHPPAESVFPRARQGRSLPRCGELAFRTPARHRARTGNLEWKDPDPRRRSSRGSGAQNRLPARQWRLRDACGLSRLNEFLALWSQACMPSCNRQVTSTSVRRQHGQTRPGRRSSRSRTAISGPIVFGLNNFRSPNIYCVHEGRHS